MRQLFVLAFALTPGLAFAAEPSVEAGKKLYGQTCIACHGANGKGTIPGVADLSKAGGALAKSDDQLFTSIKDGFQSPGNALAMPAKGGNPALTDKDIQALVAYLRNKFGS